MGTPPLHQVQFRGASVREVVATRTPPSSRPWAGIRSVVARAAERWIPDHAAVAAVRGDGRVCGRYQSERDPHLV